MNKKALSLAISLALTIPTLTNALSLGDIESNSSLNQPFRGKINLHSTSAAEAKTLKVRVASQAVFNRVGIDRPAFLNSIRFRTTVQNGKPVILVSSNQPINEPFLNFLLEVSWPNGQLLKEYTVLLDPPVLMRPDTAIASNNAGVRAEPRAQGRITRPAARAPQMTQQQRQAQAQRQAQQQRQVQAQRRAQQQAARPRARTEAEIFAETARRILGQQAQQPIARTTARSTRRVASVGRTYRVKRGDTLSKVAKRLGYRGVRSNQMMVALFEKNRAAFSKNNMNNLKSGVLLKRPSLQEAKVLTAKQSKAQIIAQAREWKNARGQAVAAVASKGSKSTPKVASNNQAHMTVAGSSGSVNAGASGNGDIAKLNKQLTMTKESLTSKQKENEELKSRVTELQSLLRKKNRLITLKSEQLAKLQAAANVMPETTEVAGTPEPEVNMDPVVENESEIQTGIATELTNGDGVIIRNGEDPVAMTTEEPTPAMVEQAPEIEPIAEEPASIVAAPVIAAPEESGTDILGLLSSPTVLGSGAALGLLGLGGLWFMRRRKEDDFEDFDSSDLDSIDIDTQMGDDEMSFDDSQIDESEFVSHDEPSQTTETVNHLIEDDGDEDILQEADVYIVYGLHDQAESELKQAIEKDPTNMAFRAKLLENYKAAGDVEAFEEEAKAFLSIDSADKETYLDDIKSWGSSLNPSNNLFSESSMAAAAVAGAGVAMVAGTASASDEFEALAEDALESDLDILGGLETDELEDINLDDILSDDDDGLIDNSDDIALGIDDGATGGNFEEITGDLEAEIGSVDDLLDAGDEIDLSEGLDLDFDAGLDDSIDSFETIGEINLDDISENGDMDLTNLSLDIDGDDFDKIMPEDNAYKSSAKDEVAEEVASDITDLDLDLDLDGEDNLLADFDDNLSFLDLDDDAEVIEETQVETKLDLAKAYIDMGDIEGARSTLEEVMADGSDDQKREAEELLQKTG